MGDFNIGVMVGLVPGLLVGFYFGWIVDRSWRQACFKQLMDRGHLTFTEKYREDRASGLHG